MQPPGVGNLKKYTHIYLYIYIYICINAHKTRGPKSLQKEEWNEHVAVTRKGGMFRWEIENNRL